MTKRVTQHERDEYDRQRLPHAYARAKYYAERHSRAAREALARGDRSEAEELRTLAHNCEEYAAALNDRGHELGLALAAERAQGELF